MANFTQDTVVSIPGEDVPSWVKSDQIGIYTDVILATMVTYDAGEFFKWLVSEWL